MQTRSQRASHAGILILRPREVSSVGLVVLLLPALPEPMALLAVVATLVPIIIGGRTAWWSALLLTLRGGLLVWCAGFAAMSVPFATSTVIVAVRGAATSRLALVRLQLLLGVI